MKVETMSNEIKEIKEIKNAAKDATPALVRLLAACWNLLMHGLVAVKAMPYLRKFPWIWAIIAVAALASIILLPVTALVFVPLAIVAFLKKPTAEHDFIIPTDDAIIE